MRNPRLTPETLEVPEGLIAFTVDLDETQMTITVKPEQLDTAMAEMGAELGAWQYRSVVDNLVQHCRSPGKTGQKLRIYSLGLLWTAFNHPVIGEALHDATLERLNENGRAHITWRFDRSILVSLGDRFVDLKELRLHDMASAGGDPDPEAATLMIT